VISVHYRTLGRTGLEVSSVALGAGPVPALMTGADSDMQRKVLTRALAVGINWIDTAPGYGDGRSEASLGRALADLSARERFHVATKVRLTLADLDDVEAAVRRSLRESFGRLGLPAVTLLQLHNGITAQRGAIPAGLTPDDVLRPGGVADAFARVRSDGLVQFVGLTGTGEPAALGAVIESGRFDTVQIPHHVLAPADADVLGHCRAQDMGVFAIRVFAGGALLGHAPSAHTLKTPYFPLALYESDRRRAAELEVELAAGMSLKEVALRYALSGEVPQIALIGLASPEQVAEVAALADRGALADTLRARLQAIRGRE
jgi:aryl-alcohol dehydrogenase-like predicted oxidoreductase